MWLILGATLGLAAFVNHERRRSLRVELGPPAEYGSMTVRMPRAWDVIAPNESDPRVVVSATEPAQTPTRRPGQGRTVTILRERLPAARGPLEHLLISISQPAAVQGPAQWQDAIESVTIGGWPGLMVSLAKVQQNQLEKRAQPDEPDDDPRGWPRKAYVACAVLPSRHAVVIQLEGSGTNELSDVEVLKQIAAGIEITAQPPLGQPGETVALEGGARVTAPNGFRPVYENDPNRIERQLWGSGDARSWTSCELVPLLLAPEEMGKEAQAIAIALQTRDRRLRGAVIEADKEHPRRWRIAPTPTPFSELFPTIAYVIADERGDRGAISAGPRRAVLAVFRGAEGTQRRFEQAWEEIAGGVSFVGETDYAAMLALGETEARRLSDRGMARLIRSPRDEQWWLWLDEDEHVNLGWSSVAWDLSGPPPQKRTTAAAPAGAPAPWGERRTVRRGTDGRLIHVTEEWFGDLRTYELFANTTVGDGTETFKQTTRFDGGELVMTETAGRNKRTGHWERVAPPQFVPGGWLSLLIGELTRQPLILRTESFVGHEGSAPPEPMTLIVAHNAEATTRSAVDGTPLRCVTVQVNGSGEVSRWFFREDGRTERIEFAAGLRRLPSDPKTVRFTFEHDEGMLP